MISARKTKHLDVKTMFTYSDANTPLGQSERAYYLSYFINCYALDHEVASPADILSCSSRNNSSPHEQGEREPFPSLPPTPLISHPFRSNSFYTKTHFRSLVTREEKEGGGGGLPEKP